ncbi:hypothetical protein T484DRAFT_1864303, partial [Baffinella frigidus]
MGTPQDSEKNAIKLANGQTITYDSLVDPEKNAINLAIGQTVTYDSLVKSIKLANGQTVTYDPLVVSTGLKNDYEKIPGLKEALADPKCP